MTSETEERAAIAQERREAEALQHGTLPQTHLPPCQHYWLQYMTNAVVDDEPEGGYVEPFLEPDGYYCVHCPARCDESRVITNPEAAG